MSQYWAPNHLSFILFTFSVIFFGVFPGACDAWWMHGLEHCPLGYVEVRGCVPVGNIDKGSIHPMGHPGPPGRPHGPSAPPPPPPPTDPPSCPTGFKYSTVFNGCVFDKKPKPPSPPPPPPAEGPAPQQPPSQPPA